MDKYQKIAAADKNNGQQVQKQVSTAQKISEIIKSSFDLECDISPEDQLEDDLGLDSLEYVELIMDLEKHYNISISDRDADKIKTFGQLVNAVDEHLAKSNGLKGMEPAGNTEYSAEQIEEQVLKIVSEACDTCDTPVTMDSYLSEDLECDSLDILEIIVRCEQNFNIDISLDDREKIATVKDLVELVKSNIHMKKQ